MATATITKSKGKKGQKVRGVWWREDRKEWWIRWTCTLHKKHREVVQPERIEVARPDGTKTVQLIEPDKDVAKRVLANRVANVKAAKKAGHHWCPRDLPTTNDGPVLFLDVLEDYLRRRDIKARDEAERAVRRHKERARVEYVRARFGSRPIAAITTKDVESMYLELRSHTVGKGKGQRPVTISTVNRYMKLLHAVLRLAQRRGLIATNPAASVELARENNTRNRYLSDDEETALRNALPDWLKPLVTVALHTGCRRGELFGSKWADVDLDGGTLHLRKDKAGDGRWVVLNAKAQEALRSIKRRRGVLSPFVFCTPQGRPLDPDTFKRHWRAVTKAAGLTGFRFHDLRHTFASRLIQDGANPYHVQQLGGWRTASMMARYAHLDPSTLRATAARLVSRKANGGANGHQNGHQAAGDGSAAVRAESVSA